MSKTEIAAQSEVPAYLQNYDAGITQDNFGAEDVAIPQIKLLQGVSPEISEHDDAHSGNFWHTGADKDLGKEVRFVICSRRKKFILSPPLIPENAGLGMFARSDDAVNWDRTGEFTCHVDKKTKVTWKIEDVNVAKSGLTQWGTSDPDDENSPPAATMIYEYLVILPDYPELGPAVLSIARSGIRKAKKGLNDKIAMHAQAKRPVQALVFKAEAVVESNAANQDFNNWKFTASGFAPEETFTMAREIGETLTTYAVQDEGKFDEEKAYSGEDDPNSKF